MQLGRRNRFPHNGGGGNCPQPGTRHCHAVSATHLPCLSVTTGPSCGLRRARPGPPAHTASCLTSLYPRLTALEESVLAMCSGGVGRLEYRCHKPLVNVKCSASMYIVSCSIEAAENSLNGVNISLRSSSYVTKYRECDLR